MRSYVAALLSLSLMACGGRTSDNGNGNGDVDEPVETVYYVDGVEVVTENDNGPDEGVMTSAVMVYRDAALELFELDDDTELWRSIVEIRWDDDLVPPNGGRYDPTARTMLLEYQGCVVDTLLFRLLAAHYQYQIDSSALTDATIAWSENLAGNNTALCAPSP